MDLHNNKVGSLLLEKLIHKSLEDTVIYLKEKAAQAAQIDSVDDIKKFDDQLVYISEE